MLQALTSYPIETYTVDKSYDSTRFLKLRLEVCHDGANRKNTYFDASVIKKAMGSIAYAPILANVVYDKDGNPKFGSHDMHLEPDKMNDDEYRAIYDETPIGFVPADNNAELVEKDGRKYLAVDAYVWRGYSNYAEDLLEENESVQLSMEITMHKYTFDDKEGFYRIEDFSFKGITLLGDDRTPGMEGANATVVSEYDFDAFVDEMQAEMNSISHANMQKKEEPTIELPVENAEIVETNELEQADEQPQEQAQGQEAEMSFELTNTVRDGLEEAVHAIDPEDRWHYYLMDFDPAKSEVYFIDQRGRKMYAAPYTLSGEVYSVDTAAKRRVKVAYVDYADGFDPVNYVFDAICNHFESALSDEKDKYDNYVASHQTDDAAVKELKDFREARLKADHEASMDAVLAQFEDLTENEEFASLRETAYSFESPEELELRCYAIRGKMAKPAAPAQKKVVAKQQLPETEADDVPYGGLLDKYRQ